MKYPIVQHIEEDCGAASLATVSLHYRRRFSISRIRELVLDNPSSFAVRTVHC
ncbi:cysteine peptidase family C39 domain-containing protein [Microseira sp. BLCC-F43]|jgi:ABC-type bacteriocin/lantibiotic exporter with double-glycine peptidase domain|uniref:cysteine peptidase family C39 domain-containing protein n=1 Tax=Microseira sp. BLCC-F43 TaxID=3153602 RepID=UPI0035B896CC